MRIKREYEKHNEIPHAGNIKISDCLNSVSFVNIRIKKYVLIMFAHTQFFNIFGQIL